MIVDSKYTYGRILLKLSGEALRGNSDGPYDRDLVKGMVGHLGNLVDSGIEMGIVIGGGNIWRGAKASDSSLQRSSSDYMGMLATAMNAIYLRDAFNSAGYSAEVQSSIPILPATAGFDPISAVKSLEEGRIVIFAGGTGNPYFTTDTAAVLRALETGAEAVLKATKVDGIYSEDPKKNPNARRYETLTYEEALAQRLEIMDSTAFSLCRDNGLPIIVFDFSNPQNIEKVLEGDNSVGTVVSD